MNMNVYEFLDATKRNYERATRTGNAHYIADVFRAYETFRLLYRMDIITQKTFDSYLSIFHDMASNLYVDLFKNKELYKFVKELTTSRFFDEDKRRDET